MSEPQFTLKELTQEELHTFNTELQALVDKHSIHIEAKPAFETDGRVIAKIVVSKKIELVPKEDGSLVPKDKDNAKESK